MPKKSRGAEDFLPELLRFCPPETRVWVEAVFILGRALRAEERGATDEPVNDIGLFLDMVRVAAVEWRDVGRIVTEGSRAAVPRQQQEG